MIEALCIAAGSIVITVAGFTYGLLHYRVRRVENCKQTKAICDERTKAFKEALAKGDVKFDDLIASVNETNNCIKKVDKTVALMGKDIDFLAKDRRTFLGKVEGESSP